MRTTSIYCADRLTSSVSNATSKMYNHQQNKRSCHTCDLSQSSWILDAYSKPHQRNIKHIPRAPMICTWIADTAPPNQPQHTKPSHYHYEIDDYEDKTIQTMICWELYIGKNREILSAKRGGAGVTMPTYSFLNFPVFIIFFYLIFRIAIIVVVCHGLPTNCFVGHFPEIMTHKSKMVLLV